MKNTGILIAALALAGAAAAIYVIASRPEESPSAGAASRGGQPTAEERAAITEVFQSIGDRFKAAEAQQASPTADALRSAAASGDHGEIARAFSQSIQGREQKMSEVLPAIRSYLSHADPFVRLTAARTLSTAGDQAGFPVLEAMVNAPGPIPGGSQDLRIEAARELAKYRVSDAAPSIITLYGTTKDARLLSALATLGQRAPQAAALPYIASSQAISEYAKSGAVEHLPKIAETFRLTKDAKVKNAAAWALARSGDARGTDYLVQAAQPAMEGGQPGAQENTPATDALRYLGSIPSPSARQALEAALQSPNPAAVRYAVVNLLFNFPEGSEKAKQVVLQELNGTQRRLGTELTLNIASKLDDPEIRAAGENLDLRSGGNSWKLYSTDRKSWPIYNWIDDYVIYLDPQRSRR